MAPGFNDDDYYVVNKKTKKVYSRLGKQRVPFGKKPDEHLHYYLKHPDHTIVKGMSAKHDGYSFEQRNEEFMDKRLTMVFEAVKIEEEHKAKDHIEHELGEKDINSKVEGDTVKVHSSNLAAAKKHVARLGYKHKVVSGLNEEVESLEEAVKTGNEGYGYHGQASAKHDGDSAKAAAKYAKTHALVMKHANTNETAAKHYLDSVHGRHLFGHENEEYIKRDFAKFSKNYKPEHFDESVESLESLDEGFINGREYASHGLMHPDHAKWDSHKVKPGKSYVDFYAHGTGDKVSGIVTKNDGKAVHIKDTTGKTHKFTVTPHLPVKEEVEQLDEFIFKTSAEKQAEIHKRAKDAFEKRKADRAQTKKSEFVWDSSSHDTTMKRGNQ